MDSIAGFRDRGTKTGELATVVEEDFAVSGEVILFEGRGCQGGFGVEETRELRYQGFALHFRALSAHEEMHIPVTELSYLL